MASRRTQSTRISELEERIEELEGSQGEYHEHHNDGHDSTNDGAQVCSLPILPKREFEIGISLDREEAILSTGDKRCLSKELSADFMRRL